MFRQGIMRERLYELVDQFRQKGATSPERAMTLEELGLPPRFKMLMQRRLVQLGIFIEMTGRYYLSEERIQQLDGQRSARRTASDARKKLLNLRIIRILVSILFIALLLVNVFVQSLEMRLVSSAFLIVILAISLLQLYYLTRIRKRGPS